MEKNVVPKKSLKINKFIKRAGFIVASLLPGYLPNISLDDSSGELKSVLTVKVDDLVGKRSVLFKNIKKRK